MTDEPTFERRWRRVLEHSDPDVRMMANRLRREPVLSALFAFTTDETLFRFSAVDPYDFSLPYLEIDRETGFFAVCGADLDAIGTLEEMVPVLVEQVKRHLDGVRR